MIIYPFVIHVNGRSRDNLTPVTDYIYTYHSRWEKVYCKLSTQYKRYPTFLQNIFSSPLVLFCASDTLQYGKTYAKRKLVKYDALLDLEKNHWTAQLGP